MEASSQPPTSEPMPEAPAKPAGRWNPRTVRILAVVIAIVVIVSAFVVYYVVTRPTCGSLKSASPLIFDQPEKPDTLDPAVTFSTPGWGITQQVYQTLVMYNGSSYTNYVGVLAYNNWTISSDRLTYTFYLRSGIHFSNNDPFNAYVMWFSLYRGLLMNQPPQFILGENFWYPNATYYSSKSDQANATGNLTKELNTWNFFSPTAAQIAIMSDPNQSFQVIDSKTIALHLGNGYLATPYTYTLATLAAPIAAAVDPAVIQAHPNPPATGGKAVANTTNDWMSLNMLGTGPYSLNSADYNQATGFTLRPNSNYWGDAAATAEPWNNAIQPAKSSIQIDFQSDPAITVQDLNSGSVVGASFAYLGPSTVQSLISAGCVNVKTLSVTYGSTSGGWWIYMNQTVAPFSDIHVREAVVHAINYQEIISVAFGNYATRWVGPVPPGYPDYNPAGLQPYQYNLSLAMQEMNQSKWPLPTGYPSTINYEYIKLGDWDTVATLLQGYLAKIGIKINPVGIDLDTLYTEQQIDPTTGKCTAQEAVNGGPFPIGQEFYTSDYISPDDWTQNNAYSLGSANMCMSGYANLTMDGLVYSAASDNNPANLTADYTQMTQLMYDNYTNAWLVVPTSFQVYNNALQGVTSNPMGSALPFTMLFNTEYVNATA